MKNLYIKTSLVLSGVVASSMAMAADHTAAIALAQTDATTNVQRLQLR